MRDYGWVSRKLDGFWAFFENFLFFGSLRTKICAVFVYNIVEILKSSRKLTLWRGYIQLTEFRYEFQEKLLFRLLTKIKRPQGKKFHLPSLRSRDQNIFNNQNNSRDENFTRSFRSDSHFYHIEIIDYHFRGYPRWLYGDIPHSTIGDIPYIILNRKSSVISKRKSYIISKGAYVKA